MTGYLAGGFRARDAGTLAQVVGPRTAVTVVVAHRHPVAADAADQESLEQSGALARRRARAPGIPGQRVLPDAALVLLELVPGQVAGVGIVDERGPLGAVDTILVGSPVGGRARARTSEAERAGVPGVVQDLKGAGVVEFVPDDLVPGARRPAGEGQAPLAERAHSAGRRAGLAKDAEEGAQALLHLNVGIEDYTPEVVDEADGERDLEVAAARLVEDPAAQPPRSARARTGPGRVRRLAPT